MRFLVDECTGPAVARWLRDQSHEVFSVYENARGMSDDEVLAEANSGRWILITNDKDFGEMVFRERKPHHGVVFLRLEDEQAAAKIEPEAFVVVTERQIRFAARPNREQN